MNSAIVFKEIETFINAAWDGDVDGVAAFLGKYPEATEVTKGEPIGWTALMWAARSGNQDTIKTLLKHGAKIEARDADGMTPLMIAGARGNISAVQLLLDRGADVLAVDKAGRTAAECARAEKRSVTAMMLEDAMAVKQQAQAEAEQAAMQKVSEAQHELQDRMRAAVQTGKFRIKGARR